MWQPGLDRLRILEPAREIRGGVGEHAGAERRPRGEVREVGREARVAAASADGVASHAGHRVESRRAARRGGLGRDGRAARAGGAPSRRTASGVSATTRMRIQACCAPQYSAQAPT